MKQCECGCGHEVKLYNRFVNGHNTRIYNPTPFFKCCIPWNKNITGYTTALKGKKFSESHKIKLSENAKNRFKDKINHPMYGKKHTDETKIKIASKKIGQHHSEDTKQKLRKLMQYKLPDNSKELTPELGYVIGAILGDGYVRYCKHGNYIALNVRDEDFADYFKEQIEKWSGKNATKNSYRKNCEKYQNTLKLKNEGYSYGNISKIINISITTIHKWLVKNTKPRLYGELYEV